MVNSAHSLYEADICISISVGGCADAKGVVASLAQLLFGFNCNILQSDQFSDESLQPSRFFQVSNALQSL